MAGLLKLFIDTRRKVLCASATNRDTFPLPNLIQGQQTFSVCLCEESADVTEGEPYTLISPQTYDLSIGLYKASDGTELAYQNEFSDDADDSAKIGNLGLNTAAIQSAVSGTPLACILEITSTNMEGQEERYQVNANLRRALGLTSVTPPPNQTVALQSWVSAGFVRLEESAGQRLVLKCPTGVYGVEIGVDDNGSAYMNAVLL